MKRDHQLQMELLLSYRQLFKGIREVLRTCINDSDLTELQALVLASLRENEKVSIHELSTLVSCSEGQASTVIDQLFGMGLVERKRSTEDRRRIMLEVTSLGQQKLDYLFGADSLFMQSLSHLFAEAGVGMESVIDTNQRLIEKLQVEGVNQQICEAND